MAEHYSLYEEQIMKQLEQWEIALLRPSGRLEGLSRSVQSRINKVLPVRVHNAITAAVRGIIQTTLFSMDYIPANNPLTGASLAESDIKSEQLLVFYKRLAAAEGAGTGAGGILLGLADFPILIGIKLKFLFELAHAYGYSTRDMRERLFILHVFQLAFSSRTKKPALLDTIKHWKQNTPQAALAEPYADQVDWLQLQQEYRDTIDFRKMLQLVPGIGAVVGAWANYGLLEELGQVGMNCYRLRRLTDK
ncbi:EcsC family protein [Paenibacillus sp. sptzw28]|uniref:EcsC family protein n=1 Tax=Paenibacillus sp. sptzw28 TaxID=715179 RepID=UPI001C6DD798|nr:EcsC family protein [Paenibacillus sp. sptzw28]QYR23209.1 EcsC family protein [Paenibacillus sp. sptzw28]